MSSIETRTPQLYLAPRRAHGGADVYLLQSYYNTFPKSSTLFLPKSTFTYSFSIGDSAESSDIILVPQAITNTSPETLEYLGSVDVLAKKFGKPVALFLGGDLSHSLVFPQFNFYIFRGTHYKSLEKEKDIVIPPICDDLGLIEGVTYRTKGRKPVIGFCGWAGFSTKSHYIKYLIKNFFIDLKKLLTLNPSHEVFKKGLYFRRKALASLRNSNLVTSNFIVRKSFSGNKSTITLSEEQARREYIQNMKDSDFVLAPKGDANYSVRFFEALSLGRIPILIDTETCLPFEDRIDYSKCVIKVSYKDIKKLPKIIAETYTRLSDEEFLAMQKAARETFETYLRYDSFFNTTFREIKGL